MPFDEAVNVNPPVVLKRGADYGFVDMDSVSPGARYVDAVGQRAFEGGGARFMHDDTLMARITPCLENGKIARFRGKSASEVAFGSTEFIVIRGRPDVTDNDFAHYLTRWDYVRGYAISQMTGSSGRQRVPTEALGAIDVAVPPLPVQRTIARILGALDDKIELNRKMNETLEQMARAIFKSWFIDFKPFRDKGMQDSELGPIPRGWKAGTVSDVAEFNAWTLRDADKLDHIEYVEISEVTRGDVMNVQVFTRGTEPSRARRRLRHGDTVLSTVRPERESYFLCLNPPANLIASTGFAVFTPTAAPWSFVHAALTRPDVFEHLGSQADGGAYPSVHPEVIAAWPVPLPPAAILNEFQRICVPLYQRAAHNRTESRTLAAIRDALLPKLMSGEVRATEYE